MKDKIVRASDKVKGLRARSKRNIKGFKKSYKAYAAAKSPHKWKDTQKAGLGFYKEIGSGMGAGAKAYGRAGKRVGKAAIAGGKDVIRTQRQSRKKIGKAYGKWFKMDKPIFDPKVRKDVRGKRKAMFKAAFAQHEVTREEVINALVETFMSK